MKEHRCPKCNCLLFKYDDLSLCGGKVRIETKHRCRKVENTKIKDVKVIE